MKDPNEHQDGDQDVGVVDANDDDDVNLPTQTATPAKHDSNTELLVKTPTADSDYETAARRALTAGATLAMARETLLARLARKSSENPVVLPAVAATVACVVQMTRIQRSGSPTQLRAARRLRVACQLLALGAAAGGAAFQLAQRAFFPSALQRIERATLLTTSTSSPPSHTSS